MPTPVSTARQCLTPEAGQSLDEAVSVARRRGHGQTTSLHAVSALLSLPSSSLLREACGRARNNAYSSRIQFKALELSLGVSLDRLPSSPQRVDEPPVSNSLMAAIKRSQANQRRQPDNFLLYQQMQQPSSSSSLSTVKVELRNLILSILDDPVVSRVFAEAGFRSCDIKLAILRPVHQLFHYSRYKEPPLFAGGLSFPFLGFCGGYNGDENCRRIGEVLARKTGRNPLLVGVCALDALRNFSETVQSRRGGSVLPVELFGLSVICIENEVAKFVTGNYDEGLVKLRFEEHFTGGGVVINFGDLKALVSDGASVGAVSYLIRELAGLVEVHGGKVWLIGATARYDTFFEFLKKFPSVEKDWDLQLLPITSPGPPMGTTYPRSSLMESFVPFGGFFSAPSDMKNPLSGSYQCVSRCHLCNEKCEQEVTALSKGGYSASVADQYQSSLPSWLQMAGHVVKAKNDDGIVLSAKVAALQKKWDNICQHLHYTQLLPKANSYKVDSQVPAVVGFQIVEDGKESVDDHSSNTNASSTESECKSIKSCRSTDLRQHSTSKSITPSDVISEPANLNFLSKLCEKPSKFEDKVGGLRYPPCSLSSSSVANGWTSPTSATSVTTDLGLGIQSSSTGRELEKPTNQAHLVLQDFSGSYSSNVDQKDFKKLYMSLVNRIGRQEEAISAISQTIVHCRTRNEKHHGASRGDIWFNFLGPDSLGKKKIAVALAEILYRSRESIICVDLNFQDGMIHTNSPFDRQEINSYDMKFRGKTIVDYIVEELSKKPLSVVYLENIDKADLPTQNKLSLAVRTGRFSDSHGREVSIGNAIFVTSSRFTEFNKILSSEKNTGNYLEESVLRAKGWPIQMLIGFDLGDNVISHNLHVLDITRKGGCNPIFVNKRKLDGANEMAKRAHKASNMYMDLNLPAGESEISDADCENSENDPICENTKAWLEDFFGQVDETVVFKPFDYDAVAEKMLTKISGCFRNIVGSDGLLEIDLKVMEQILLAACLSETNRVDDWVEHVLNGAFLEAQKRYNLSSRSVVKLVTCEGLVPENQAPGVLLPARIIMN